MNVTTWFLNWSTLRMTILIFIFISMQSKSKHSNSSLKSMYLKKEQKKLMLKSMHYSKDHIIFRTSRNLRQNELLDQFWSEFGEVSFIKSEFSSVSTKIMRVGMDWAPLNSFGSPKLSKFNNSIMNLQKLWLNFYQIPLKTS